MNYEGAWRELKDFFKRNNIKKDIVELMDRIEGKYGTKYVCIKNKKDELIKGNKYEVINQDQYYIWVSAEKNCTIFLGYEEFNQYLI